MLQSIVSFCAAVTIMAAPQPPETVRVAAFNIWKLSSQKLNQVNAQGHGENGQLRTAATIIQIVRPDVLLINEIDFDAEKQANAAAFRDRYLKVAQADQKPIDYPYVYFAPVNTGVPSGHDLDNDGKVEGPRDAFGYGSYPGQYGMALYSKFPIDAEAARTFQKLLWKRMPKNLMPDGKGGKPAWYSAEETAVLRLSSKSHWDVPVKIGDAVVHLLACHPTPPVFDGKEDRNGRRNFDEVRFWADYITGDKQARYIKDDNGQRGGLEQNASFIVIGDLNADPFRDSGTYGQTPIDQLLKHPRVQDPKPKSKGAAAFAEPYPGDKSGRTSKFGRVDYVLPSKDLKVTDSGVFWPGPDDTQRFLVIKREVSSDHRLVWVDIVVPKSKP